MLPKISIITVVRNGENTLSDCLSSVQSQKYPVEHIVIDGASTDNTVEIINKYRAGISKFVSEPDAGIYEAMNKGVRLSTGDVVGFLNADDFYVRDNITLMVAEAFRSHQIESLFADLIIVKPENLNNIVRYYSGADFTIDKFASGLMPPHPTFFVKRHCFEKYGFFETDYKIAADFELLLRFLYKQRISYYYLPEVIIKMRSGGVSTKNLRSNIILNKEILRACRDNGINTNLLMIYSKYFKKCMQLFTRPR